MNAAFALSAPCIHAGSRTSSRCFTSTTPNVRQCGGAKKRIAPRCLTSTPPPKPPSNAKKSTTLATPVDEQPKSEVEPNVAEDIDAALDSTDNSFEWLTTAKTAGIFGASVGLLGLLALILQAEGEGAVVHAVEELIKFEQGPHFLVALGMGLSAFIQALTGFGFAVVAVGGLAQIDWIAHSSVFDVVQPVAATFSAATGWSLILPELRKVEWKGISALLISSTLATPVGVALLNIVDGHVVLRGLGAIIAAYVAYALTGIAVPKVVGGRIGAWIMGGLAGTLGGAFDITGPPLVVHGEAAKWNQDNGTFRRNTLAVVSVNSTVVVLYDAISGRLNDFYYADFVKYAAPTVVLGVLVGKWLSSRLDASTFKKVVLGTCMLLGVKLILS